MTYSIRLQCSVLVEMAAGFSIRFLPRRASLALVFSLLSLGLTTCAWAAEPDWRAVEKEAGELLSRYLQIDTTNPPGNEIAAAAFWQQRLTQEGLEAQVDLQQMADLIAFLKRGAT